jgi:hypothetical protein
MPSMLQLNVRVGQTHREIRIRSRLKAENVFKKVYIKVNWRLHEHRENGAFDLSASYSHSLSEWAVDDETGDRMRMRIDIKLLTALERLHEHAH